MLCADAEPTVAGGAGCASGQFAVSGVDGPVHSTCHTDAADLPATAVGHRIDLPDTTLYDRP